MVSHVLQGSDRTFRSTTSYTQLSWAFGKTRPYFRYDYQNIPKGDPIFGELGRLNGPSIGVNRRLSEYVLLKLQYGRLGERGVPTSNTFMTQMAFTF
jgi:hypothetical protein